MSSSLSSSLLPLYARAPFAFVRGEGVTLYDEEGTGYLDFGAGIAVSAFGHAHPKLVEALKIQADKLWHTSNLYSMPGQEALARRLTAASFADKVFFCNSGAEAMEAAIKMARHYHFAAGAPERYRLITFEGAFHGRTLATIAAGGQAKYLEGFGPRVPGFDQVAFGDLAAVKDAIGPETAGILVEPIQGEGGVRPLPDGFLRALRTLCDEEGLLLVLDEVQTGMGRTGKLFAHEWSGVVPDIMGVAKALGGGFPVGAVLASEKAATGMGAGTHGTTFGGNQLAMAVAGAALDLVLEPGFLPHVQQMGLRLKQRLAELVDNYPDVFADVRGSGLLLGLKMNCVNTDFVKALFDERILAVQAGDNVVRLLPPLIVQEADILDAAGRLERAAARLRKEAT